MKFSNRVAAAWRALRGAAPTRAQASVWGVQPAYEGAAYNRRTAGWAPGNDSVNATLYGSADTLRARSRDMIRKNAWASNGSEVLVSEAIGTGIKPQSLHPDLATKTDLEKLWLEWTDYADADGIQDFYGLQALAVRSMVEGGECFIRLRQRRPEDNYRVPLQLQVLEAEHCPMWKNESLPGGFTIRNGIEFNIIGQRVAYWLYPIHPGERGIILGPGDDLQPRRVPAEQVLHIFRRQRPGQIRGEPWFSRALIRLLDYDQYTDATLMRQKVAALFAGVITEVNDADDLPTQATLNMPGTGETGPPGVAYAGLEPGTLQKLAPGESITFSNPPSAGTGFKEFNVACLREIAASVGCTYEQLTGDLTGVNYSSIRAGLLGFRRKTEQIQHTVVVFQMCRPLWKAWLEAAVFGGEIKASIYARQQRQYLAVKWIPPGWQWVDPEVEVAAAKAAVRNGFKSAASVISEQGEDIEDVYNQIALGNKLADSLGLILDTDPRQTTDNGLRPSRDAQNPDGLANPEGPPPDEAAPAQPPPAKTAGRNKKSGKPLVN